MRPLSVVPPGQCQAKPLRKHGGVNKYNKDEVGVHQLHNGTTSSYLAARIARHPEIYERMQQGEFKSVAAAAKEAGIYLEKPRRITASPDKSMLAKSLLQACEPDGCEELVDVLRDAIAQSRAQPA